MADYMRYTRSNFNEMYPQYSSWLKSYRAGEPQRRGELGGRAGHVSAAAAAQVDQLDHHGGWRWLRAASRQWPHVSRWQRPDGPEMNHYKIAIFVFIVVPWAVAGIAWMWFFRPLGWLGQKAGPFFGSSQHSTPPFPPDYFK